MFTTVLIAAFAGLASALTLTSRDGVSLKDDGPYIYHLKRSRSQQIADQATEMGVPVTFFVNGKNWGCIYDEAAQTALNNSYKAGHQIAAHTWSHPSLPSCTAEEVDYQITKNVEAIRRITGCDPSCMRPPYGDINQSVLDAIAAKNMTTVTWNVDCGDSTNATYTQCQAALQKQLPTKDGSEAAILIQHETNNYTAQNILGYVVPLLKNLNYTLVTVAQCLGIAACNSVSEPESPTWGWDCPERTADCKSD
ncbi:hypothetical protein C8R46DRAFT_1343147 [Mycena filopes]|nr:hypothetical protein C8R46DRAFT_1343147 [Mycena filopes]